MLVTSYSDRQPGKFSLFNSDTGKLSIIGETQPLIQPAQMSEQQLVRYTARDGQSIPAWLTVPATTCGKQLPLVVLVHGAPYVRGSSWQWNAEVQFLASRGYAVLQPEFRGSTGFGAKHFRAGWKQWGLKMQNDLADGARWAIAEGIAEPRRICIAGASYGGDAALMGLVNDPDLFRCAIDWVGMTDINLCTAATGASSPPSAMTGNSTACLEWVVYDEEGHGWTLLKNRIDFWGRVEKFLDRNIGKDSVPLKKE